MKIVKVAVEVASETLVRFKLAEGRSQLSTREDRALNSLVRFNLVLNHCEKKLTIHCCML